MAQAAITEYTYLELLQRPQITILFYQISSKQMEQPQITMLLLLQQTLMQMKLQTIIFQHMEHQLIMEYISLAPHSHPIITR